MYLPLATGPLAPYIQQEIAHIQGHKERVKQSLQLFRDIGFIEKCKKLMPCLDEAKLDKLIEFHDNGKFEDAEFDGYRQWWYPAPGEKRSKQKLNNALLHHLHSSGHHWQYWCTYDTKYDDGITILKMPCEYIIEMLCDWYSFSIKENNPMSIFSWYEQNKSEMFFHPTTRRLIEVLLIRLKNCLIRYKRSTFRDSNTCIQDERLSPMTYRKLREMGYNEEDWSGLSQEQANRIVHANKSVYKEQATNLVNNSELETLINNEPDQTKRKAYKQYEKDIHNEPKISRTIQQIATQLGIKIEGWDYRIKSEDSAIRKISQQGIVLMDSIRYTYQIEPGSLVKDYSTCVQQLEQLGYQEVVVKNYFVNPKNGYVGINTNWKSPEGTLFELQIHTPESLNLKQNINHKYYEIARSSKSTTMQKLRAIDTMIENLNKYVNNIPKNIQNIKNL